MSRSCKVMLVFLSSCSWMPVDGLTRQGITWIELLILFELSGGNICQYAEGYDSETCAHFNLTIMLSTFKRIVRSILARNFSDDSKHLFKPSKSNNLRLKGVGFANHISAVVSIPIIDESIRMRIAECLFSLHTRGTKHNLKALHQGTFAKAASSLGVNCSQARGSHLCR